MELMVMLCSRSYYIAYSHHETDVNYDMAVLQYLLSIDNDRKESGVSSAICSCQSFSNLIYHFSVHLGVSLYIFSSHALILYLSGADYVSDG